MIRVRFGKEKPLSACFKQSSTRPANSPRISAPLAAMSHCEALSGPLDTTGAKFYETNFRYYSRRTGCSRPVRGLVYAVLVAAHVSESAATTVYGLTPRRLWATTVAGLALVGVVIGGLALARPASRFGTASGRLGSIVALLVGLIAVVNGGLILAIANGGPGTGNGVVGGAAAFVLGLIALALGGVALARCCRTALEPGRMTPPSSSLDCDALFLRNS
jgi:Family of unknown function (DUF6223)